jgi:hypothetical protein
VNAALGALLRYLAIVVPANLAWEAAHIPLYTIWHEAPPREIAFAILHCTGGDALIAAASIGLAVLALGGPQWHVDGARTRRVAVATIAIALAYTVFSEWLNVSVRGSWAYSRWMPTIFGVGLSPLLQWALLPLLGFWFLDRQTAR